MNPVASQRANKSKVLMKEGTSQQKILLFHPSKNPQHIDSQLSLLRQYIIRKIVPANNIPPWHIMAHHISPIGLFRAM
jgi:hypothetical protein